MRTLALVIGLAGSATARVISIVDHGAVAGDASDKVAWANGGVLNATLALMAPGDTLIVPNGMWHLYGGILAQGLVNATIVIEGTLKFADDRSKWPKDKRNRQRNCIQLDDVAGLTLTSSTGGTLDGSGAKWWGAIKYLIYQEDRPKILEVNNGTGIVVERLHFKDPPYWTTYFHDVDGLTIRHSNITVQRGIRPPRKHDYDQLQAFNTDGFDVAGRNVHIHDCQIWNDDDCVCVKALSSKDVHKCSENWLVERVNASGVGLTVGSVGPSETGNCIRNITFRDSTMVHTWKGIYIKINPSDEPNKYGVVEDILYENITITEPTGWPIWIGPAAQVEGGNRCLFWPDVPGARCKTNGLPQMSVSNITLRNVLVERPTKSPGVLMGNFSNPIRAITFDNVTVVDPPLTPWGSEYYSCWGVEGTAVGGTTPVPPCFNGGRQCLSDGACSDRAGTPCCSGKHHHSLDCPIGGSFERCGAA